MSLLRSCFGLPETRDFSLAAWEKYLDGGGYQSESGEIVNMSTAMSLTAVYSCARIISETVGSLPIDTFKKRETKLGTFFDEAHDEDIYWLLKQSPNGHQTPMGLFETESMHGAIRGNAYMHMKKSTRNGHTKEMTHIDSGRVEVKQKNGGVLYIVQPPPGESGPPETYTSDDICHFALTSADGLKGLSPLGFARQTFGLSLSQEKYAAKLFGNGAMMRGLIYQDKPEITIDPAELADAKRTWNEANVGIQNAHKTVFLPGGLKYQPISLSPEDAQLLESRRFQLAEIARIFRVPLHLLQELVHATFSNIEHQSLEFVIHTIRPWLVRWEQTLTRDILTDRQRREGLVIKFNHDALLRGDTETQAIAMNSYIMNGVYSPNEAREKLNKNPVKGGNKHLIPLNVTTIDTPAKPADKSVPQAKRAIYMEDLVEEEERKEEQVVEQLRLVCYRTIEFSLKRLVNKESVAIKKNVRKLKASEFDSWLKEFYDGFRSDYESTICELAQCLSETGSGEEAAERTRELVGVYVDGSMADIRGLLLRDDEPVAWSTFVADVESLADRWSESRAGEFAGRHTQELMRLRNNERQAI